MSRTFHAWYGRRSTDSRTTLTKPSITIAERRARKARRQLQQLFPHLAHRFHKGVSQASIYQHALRLAQPPAAPPKPSAGSRHSLTKTTVR